MKIYNPDNVKRIGTYADNIPRTLISYAPGIDKTPTHFAIDSTTGKIYAFVDKKGQFFGDELGMTPMLRDEHAYIIEHGQDVTEKIKELVAVSDFHANKERQP